MGWGRGFGVGAGPPRAVGLGRVRSGLVGRARRGSVAVAKCGMLGHNAAGKSESVSKSCTRKVPYFGCW